MAKKNFKTKLSKSVDMKVDEFGNIGHVDLMQSISSVNPVRPPLGKHIPQSPKPLRPRPPVTLPEVSPWGPISPTTSQHLFFIDHITWQLGTVGEGSGMNELDSNDWIGVFATNGHPLPIAADGSDNWTLIGGRQW